MMKNKILLAFVFLFSFAICLGEKNYEEKSLQMEITYEVININDKKISAINAIEYVFPEKTQHDEDLKKYSEDAVKEWNLELRNIDSKVKAEDIVLREKILFIFLFSSYTTVSDFKSGLIKIFCIDKSNNRVFEEWNLIYNNEQLINHTVSINGAVVEGKSMSYIKSMYNRYF